MVPKRHQITRSRNGTGVVRDGSIVAEEGDGAVRRRGKGAEG